MYEIVAVFFKFPKWDMVSTRWTTELSNSLLLPAIVVSLLVEIGEVDLFVLLSIFIIHHISVLVTYLIEWDGQSQTSSSRVAFDRMLALFIAVLAGLPIFLSFTNPQYLTGYTITASILLLSAAVIDTVTSYMYSSSLVYDSVPGAPWSKSMSERAALAINDEIDSRAAGQLLYRSDGAPAEMKDTSLVVDVSTHSNTDKYYTYFLVKDLLVATLRFVVAILVLVGPAMESDHRNAIARSYSAMCDANTVVTQWGDYGGDDTETCMLDGMLCDYIAPNEGFVTGGYDFIFNHLPSQVYGIPTGVDGGACGTEVSSTTGLGVPITCNTAWRSLALGTFASAAAVPLPCQSQGAPSSYCTGPNTPIVTGTNTLTPLGFGISSIALTASVVTPPNTVYGTAGLGPIASVMSCCAPNLNPSGLLFGNQTAWFMCRGKSVAGCKGVSHCPSHGWKEDRRSLSNVVSTAVGGLAVAQTINKQYQSGYAYPNLGYMAADPPSSRLAIPATITSAVRAAFAPVNCLDPTKPSYVGPGNARTAAPTDLNVMWSSAPGAGGIDVRCSNVAVSNNNR